MEGMGVGRGGWKEVLDGVREEVDGVGEESGDGNER